jgi:hypothetical protein
MPSPCYHGRNTGGVRLIVLHTAEGATTIESLGNFFSNYNNQVSSHVGADDKLGKIGEYVTRGNAAWTAANYNNAAVQLELCGFASWSQSTWKNQHHNMLENAARWIVEESKKFDIPITRLNDSQAQSSGRGVCQHINLGSGGGGHVDCGSGFPMDYVLDLARGGTTTIPTEADDMDTMTHLTFVNAHTSIVVPDVLADGKTRARFGCTEPTELRVGFTGHGDEKRLNLDNRGPQNATVPNGCKMLTLTRVNGEEPISFTFSRDV